MNTTKLNNLFTEFANLDNSEYNDLNVFRFAHSVVHELFNEDEILEKTLLEYSMLMTIPTLIKRHRQLNRNLKLTVLDIVNLIEFACDLKIDVETNDFLMSKVGRCHSSYMMNLLTLSVKHERFDNFNVYHDRVIFDAKTLLESCDILKLKSLAQTLSDKIIKDRFDEKSLSKSSIRNCYKALIYRSV